MNTASYLLLFAIAAALIASLRKARRTGGCCGNCSQCSARCPGSQTPPKD